MVYFLTVFSSISKTTAYYSHIFCISSSGCHFVQQSRTILAISGKGHPKEISVIFFFKSGHLPRRCLLKVFSISSSGTHFVQWR